MVKILMCPNPLLLTCDSYMMPIFCLPVFPLYSRVSCLFCGLGTRLRQNPLHIRKTARRQASSTECKSHTGTKTLRILVKGVIGLE